MAAAVEDATAAVDAMALEYNPSNRLGFYQKRVELFEKFHEREQERIEAAKQAAVPIKVVLPDGAIKEAIKNATTPLDIANEISKSLAKKVLVAKVDGELWDAFRPLEADCALQLCTWDDADGKEVGSRAVRAHAAMRRESRRFCARAARRALLACTGPAWGRGHVHARPWQDDGLHEGFELQSRDGITYRGQHLLLAGDGQVAAVGSPALGVLLRCCLPRPSLAPTRGAIRHQQTFWHSSAHVLGEALEMEFGVDLTIGPALEEGFYYDCYMGDKVRPLQQG